MIGPKSPTNNNFKPISAADNIFKEHKVLDIYPKRPNAFLRDESEENKILHDWLFRANMLEESAYLRALRHWNNELDPLSSSSGGSEEGGLDNPEFVNPSADDPHGASKHEGIGIPEGKELHGTAPH